MLQDKRDYLQRMVRNLEKIFLRFNGIERELHFEELSLTIEKYLDEVIKVKGTDDTDEIILKMMDLSSKVTLADLEQLTEVLIIKGKISKEKKYFEAAYRVLTEIEQKDIMTFSFVRQQKIEELKQLI